MIKANNKIAANWVKIATDLQSQLIASEEDKIKLSTQIASLTAENERLHQAIVDHIEGHDWSWVDPVSRGYPDVDDLRAALQPKEDVA